MVFLEALWYLTLVLSHALGGSFLQLFDLSFDLFVQGSALADISGSRLLDGILLLFSSLSFVGTQRILLLFGNDSAKGAHREFLGIGGLKSFWFVGLLAR